jgi:hypothetical protein
LLVSSSVARATVGTDVEAFRGNCSNRETA